MSRFDRLSIIETDGKERAGRLVGRRTGVKYWTYYFPIVGPVGRYVTEGGARFASTKPDTQTTFNNFVGSGISPLRFLESLDVIQVPNHNFVLGPKIPSPSDAQIVEAATLYLNGHNTPVEKLPPTARSAIDNASGAVRRSRFYEENAKLVTDFANALLAAATSETNALLETDFTTPHYTTFVTALFKTIYSETRKPLTYSHNNRLNADPVLITEFEAALFNYILKLNAVTSDETCRIKRGSRSLVRIAGPVLSVHRSIDSQLAQAYWRLALHSRREYNVEAFLARHISALDSPVENLLAKMRGEQNPKCEPDIKRAVSYLRSLPDDAFLRYKMQIMNTVIEEHKKFSRSSSNVDLLITDFGRLGEEGRENLTTFLRQENSTFWPGAMRGLCRLGGSISDELYALIIRRMQDPSEEKSNLTSALYVIVLSGRLEQFENWLARQVEISALPEARLVWLRNRVEHIHDNGLEKYTARHPTYWYVMCR